MQEKTSPAPLRTLTDHAWFWSHLAVLLASWAAPFLVTWYFLVPIYGLVLLQFAVLGTCIMNDRHGLDDSQNHTFYADLLERLGFRPDRALVRRLVRGPNYFLFICIALLWQVWLGHKPLLF